MQSGKISLLIAALLIGAQLTGCKKDPPRADVTVPAPTPPPPAEAEGTIQKVQEKAAQAGQTPAKAREELIKEEIITEYTGVTSGARKGPALVSPEGKLCWPAMTCTNPKCPGKGRDGRPFLFAYHYKSATVGPEGKVNLHANPLVLLGTCPACFMTNTVGPYLPPEERQRYEEITRRVMQKAHANAAITKERLLTPEEYGEYRKLLEEQADVPVYYLCP
jgi:hypothetical protein